MLRDYPKGVNSLSNSLPQRPVSFQTSPSDRTWFLFQVFESLLQKNYSPEEAIKTARKVTEEAFLIKTT